MRIIVILNLAAALLAAPVTAQPNMDGFEFTPYLQPDGYRIFFDASVAWDYGGILMDPVLWFWQNEVTVDAWLVLVEPSAATIGGFRIGRSLAGYNVIAQEEILGAPLSIQIVDDIVAVVYDPPLSVDSNAAVLIHWYIINPDFASIGFHIWPAPGDETPVYFDGAGDPVPASTFNGSYHQYAAPVALLNGGVTPDDPVTWSKVKALYR